MATMTRGRDRTRKREGGSEEKDGVCACVCVREAGEVGDELRRRGTVEGWSAHDTRACSWM